MPKIKVTGSCTAAPTDGQILFPVAVAPASGLVIVTINGRNRVLNVGIRSDAGTGACLSGALLHAAGGEGNEIEWRQGHWYDVYRYGKAKLLAALIAILALAASIALAILAFTVNSSSTDTATRTTAIAVLVLTILNSIFTFTATITVQPLA
jgi:hypothetical protein